MMRQITLGNTGALKMKVEIKRYRPALHKVWDDFVANSINGTFLHSRAFFDHNSLNEKEDCSYLFYKKSKLIAVIPCLVYSRDGINVLHSFLRATYGGFVVNDEVGTEEAIDMVQLLIGQARLMQVAEIIIRNPFRIFNKALCDETDYAMWYHGFQVSARELEIAVDLKGDIAEIRKRYNNGTRYNLKKSLKSVVCRVSNDYERFWIILEENLLNKHGKKPVHSLYEFYSLKEHVGENNIKLFAGYVGDKMVCGALVFIFNKDLHAQYIGADDEYQDLRPLNAVLDYIIEWGNKNGFDYFNQGTGNSENGKNINLGLFHFKEGFGGRGTLRETMTLNLQ